ncbi:MAG: DUF167 domain-containing protein [Mycoplasmataceae bacterium]|jgi:uncharacterized protein (TIGR00251 family)|nr:DUF167 domain-containing protein [Mycoplasmataceae bacterium]
MIIKVHLVPNAKHEGVVGEYNGMVKIAVRAPAVDNKANEALIELLSKHYQVSKNKIHITKGNMSRNKTIEIN